MSNPVEAAQGAPLFGGLSGYLRSTPGSKPTSVPGSAPAFRGITNRPGQPVKAPGIRTSYNRDNRGTNIVIPYARVVPIEHLHDVGRVSPGDVVFAARTKLTPYGYGMHAQMRLVGVDWLNRMLGGRPEYDMDKMGKERHTMNWQVGYNVLLGGPQGSTDVGNKRYNAVADEWRGLAFLQEWTCDGIVLSNDQPEANNSHGERDGQLFNVAVQGVCPVNNGYVDFSGKGVELNHRGMNSNKNGYYDGGEPPEHRDFATAFGGPFYNSYPLQMFDRKLRPMSDVYVGLVCTRRVLKDNSRYKAVLKANAAGQAQKDEIDAAVYFYTFHFAYFSSNQAFGYEYADEKDAWDSTQGNYPQNPNLTEPATKRSRRHYEDAKKGQEYDAFRGMSDREWHGLVGAWRVGKVLDIAASKKDQYYGGPVDTADRITVNVDVEWKDWRQLRRDFSNGRIGRDIPGAPEWGVSGVVLTPDVPLPSGDFAQDDGRVLMWPTQYNVDPGTYDPANGQAGTWSYAAKADMAANIQPFNVPLDPMTIDQAIRGSEPARKALGDASKGRPTYGVHGLGRGSTSTYSAFGAERPLVGAPGYEKQSQLDPREHEFSLLTPPGVQATRYVAAVAASSSYFETRSAQGASANLLDPTLATPNPAIFGLGGVASADVQGAASGDADMSAAAVAPRAQGKAPAKGKAPVAAPPKKGKTPPRARPTSVAPSPSGASVAAVVTASTPAGVAATVAAAAAQKSPAQSPSASPSVANTGAAAAATAAPPQARQGVRRGRAGEQATADVFASIFGGDAAPAATSSSAAAAPSVQPSPSEGSDGGTSGNARGRVRRARDGR